MNPRLVSLAAGVHPDLAPEDMVSVAAQAGWPACGIWFDPATWTDATTAQVRRRLDDTGLVALDLEPIIPAPDTEDHGERILDTAAEIGARFVLFTSRLPEEAATIERFARLVDRARGLDTRLVCEFLPIFPLATLDAAHRVVAAHEVGEAGILVDTLHLARSGARVEDVAAIERDEPGRFPYLQLADASLSPPGDRMGLYDEAVNGRLLPDEGALPLDEICAAVPEVPLSFEIRSRVLREISDPVERARRVWASATRFVAS